MAEWGNADVNALRDKYNKTLKLADKDGVMKERRCKALNRAYALRTFEIEHYWKRATYFWGFQIAIFAAFGLLWKAQLDANGSNSSHDTNGWGLITLALSVLGVLIAVANSLSASGSKFWQENWERHIDMLEDEVEGRLHKTVWLPEGKISFSVSGINRCLSYIMIIFWFITTSFVAYKFVGAPSLINGDIMRSSAWLQLAIVLFFIVFFVVWLLRQTSSLRGTRPKEDGEHGSEIKRCSRWHRRISPDQIFISRYAPDEPD